MCAHLHFFLICGKVYVIVNLKDTTMKFKAFIKAFLIHTCIYSTVLFSAAMLFCLLGNMTSFATASYFLILAFCAFFAAANVIFAKTNLSIWWRTIIHAALTLGGFALCFLIRYADIGTPRESVTLFAVLVSVLYAICMGVFLAVRYAKQKKAEAKRYQSVYASTNDQKRR